MKVLDANAIYKMAQEAADREIDSFKSDAYIKAIAAKMYVVGFSEAMKLKR